MANRSSDGIQIISLPKGGGALPGIGEKFSPDLHTGSGNFTVPIALPPGRNGFQPQLNLVYSTGNGNGPFGLGWSLSIPGVSRKTSKGVPRYDDLTDVFILSGAEDLVRVEGSYPGKVRYRPRTEGLFAWIEHVREAGNNYWEVKSKDGLVSQYGIPLGPTAEAPVIADPRSQTHIFAWTLTRTEDPFGNKVLYDYARDKDTQGPHEWDQLYLQRIRYVGYDEPEKFLVWVTLDYGNPPQERPDAFSEYRSGFEIRTRRRCNRILVETHPVDRARSVRAYEFHYEQDALNGVSLLRSVEVVGFDDNGQEVRELPPLEFGYTRFEPKGRKFFPVHGDELPTRSLANPDTELVDLHGGGLPDILEMNGIVRYWRNLGGGRFDIPRPMKEAPAGVSLAAVGVQLIDANGDGRSDLLVTAEPLAGYFPLEFRARWNPKSFQRYRYAPSFNLEDPEVKLVDLDGDGVTDAIRSGTRIECFFNDPHEGWKPENTRWVERKALDVFPNVNFSDLRVKFADMTGDGLQDIVLVYDGNVEYWPNLGHGNWGKRVHMENSPRFPYGYGPRRILIGDVDGDGLADIVYVDHCEVRLWINQSGNGWSKEPIVIQGTPPVTDLDSTRLVDLSGSGIAGVLWSADIGALGPKNFFFLDFTGGVKSYLLNRMDNHLGAVTLVDYKPSTYFYLKDEARPSTRWRTPLPFPVQVVACVEVIDEISKGKLTTEYRYHHGYWDGGEREFRGFGMVEQLDTENFSDYHAAGLHGDTRLFAPVAQKHYSPPTLTKTWFHLGAVGEEFGEWQEQNWSHEYWSSDPPLLNHTESVNAFLGTLPVRRVRRDALRALRGSILRTELYALDGTPHQNRPYTVTEHAYSIREESKPLDPSDTRLRIFFPHAVAQRMTQWERGDDPMTQVMYTSDHDEFGQPRRQTNIACPRGWRRMEDTSNAYLATRTRTEYAKPQGTQPYIRDRVAKITTYEATNKKTVGEPTNNASRTVAEIRDLADNDRALQLIGQTLNFYDHDPARPDYGAFLGLPFGKVGKYGALVRTERLVLTEKTLQDAYGAQPPTYLSKNSAFVWPVEYPQGFQNGLAQQAGYLYKDGTDPNLEPGYWAATERRLYDFHSPTGAGRGMLLATRDALGHQATISYDSYDLLPIEVTDAAGLATKADYNYRVLQPKLVTDPNGNETEFRFSPLGLVQETWVKGNPAKVEGDRQRPSARLEYDFFAFVGSQQPIFVKTIRRIHHDTEAEVPILQRDETIETREYSDGFGRLLQTSTQGEEVRFGDEVFGGGEGVLPATQRDGAGGGVVGKESIDPSNPNVVVSGWQTYDNKGRVIEKYEPFFSTAWDYEAPSDAQLGQKASMFYDPRGQVIRTVNPDGSEQRVVYGVPGTIAKPNLDDPEVFEPAPWEAYTYDANDNSGRTHPNESASYGHHRNTPRSIVVDALGRTVVAIERDRTAPTSVTAPLPPIQELHTTSTYDMRGNLLRVTDPLGREAFKHTYDFANRPLRIDSIDAGTKRMVFDAAGNEIERRDSKGALVLRSYDELNRLTRLWARDGIGEAMSLRERLAYGDDPNAGLSGTEIVAGNLKGKLYQHYDEAGLLTFEQYDFKGNVLQKLRRVISDTAILSVFNPAPPGWQVAASRVDWETQTATALDPPASAYVTAISYDALNRIKTLQYPKDVDGTRKLLRPHYNSAGALERVELGGETYVEKITYNAKGQRTLITYGNGIMTRYAYDSMTFRLVRMRTERYKKPASDALTYQLDGGLLQDLGYRYDLAGNIRAIVDRTPGSGVLNNPGALEFQTIDPVLAQLLVAGDALVRAFAYDPLNRLTSATGRERNTIPGPRPWTDWNDAPGGAFNSGNHGTPNQDNAPNLTALYTEEYAYDPAGNMVSLRHRNNGNPWTRHFGMGGFTPQQWEQEWRNHFNAPGGWANPPGNQLTHVGDNQPATPQTHVFDANGNLTGETTSRHFEWDHADRMKAFRVQAGVAEPSIHAQYLYDSGGQRVKKLARKQGGEYEVTVYIDGLFEYHRLVKPGGTTENNTLHVMDNQSRIALVRVGDAFPGDGAPDKPVKYHIGDHLGSSGIVLGGASATASDFINREEYFPYGETSFGSFGRKRYRFTGKERDDESGLNYHGARYYQAHLGRFIEPDVLAPGPAPQALNPYSYAVSNPLKYVDPSGQTPENSPWTWTGFHPSFRLEVDPRNTLLWGPAETMNLWVFDNPFNMANMIPAQMQALERLGRAAGLTEGDIDSFNFALNMMGMEPGAAAAVESSIPYLQTRFAVTLDRLRGYAGALTNARGEIAGWREALGLIKNIRAMEREGWLISSYSFKYEYFNPNQGPDVPFRHFLDLDRWALLESKASGTPGKLPEIAKAIGGVTQGGREYYGIQLATYIERGGSNVRLAEELMRRLRMGNVETYAGFAGELYELKFDRYFQPRSAKLVE